MNNNINEISLTHLCASLAAAMGINAPSQADTSIPRLDELVRNTCGIVDRIFMYNPDAVAMWLCEKYEEWFEPVFRSTSLKLPLCTVMPSVTPVCFGTMYTGAKPEVHGIRSYSKPVIRIDTLFDALIRAGKKPAIVSTEGDSLSKIFLERDMDYYLFPTVDECTEKALDLIIEDKYDFILLYNGDYDTAMHRYSPEGEDALAALRKNISVFDRIDSAIRKNWKSHNTLLGFAPDHGCHEIDGDCGSHGLDMPEDLNILHFYSVIPEIK